MTLWNNLVRDEGARVDIYLDHQNICLLFLTNSHSYRTNPFVWFNIISNTF